MYSCKICLDDEEHISALPCGHIFGTTCAEIHLRSTPSCPTCRQPCEPRNLLRLHVDFFPGKQADAVNPPALTSGHSSADEMEEEPQLLVSGGMSILGVDLYSQNSEPRALSSPSNDCNGDGEGDEEELFSCEEDTFADVRRTSSLCLPSCSRASIGVSSCGSFDYTSSTSDSSDPTHLEEAVKTHIKFLSYAVKSGCNRLKYATLINGAIGETAYYISLSAEKKVQIDDLLEALATARQARSRARNKLLRLRQRDKEIRRRYEVAKEEFCYGTRHHVIRHEINEVKIAQLRDANILEQLRALKYREKLVDLRHLFMDEGAGILDLGDLDDTEDAPSEVSLQMPGSYPKLKCNEADRYHGDEPLTDAQPWSG